MEPPWEAWRQFLHLQHLTDHAPGRGRTLRQTRRGLGFDAFKVSDLASRAPAFQSMVGGGVDVEKLAALAGLMEGEQVDRALELAGVWPWLDPVADANVCFNRSKETP